MGDSERRVGKDKAMRLPEPPMTPMEWLEYMTILIVIAAFLLAYRLYITGRF